jgi:mono/diheme cytochrome c family protein
MLKFEELDESPQLPEAEEIVLPARKEKSAVVVQEASEDLLDPVLEELMEQNSVAHGTWLYIRHCHRCHLGYQKARMGRGVAVDTVRRTIVNGKTSTQMTAFSRMKGGKLSNREIRAVVEYISTWEKFDEPHEFLNFSVNVFAVTHKASIL